MGARRTVNGWTIPPAEIGVFGTDYGLRVSVALGGLAALPLAEAMYLSTGGPVLTGAAQVRLSFPPRQTPPVGREGNWLPAPVGRFSLNLRAYLPKRELLDGAWLPPTLVAARL